MTQAQSKCYFANGTALPDDEPYLEQKPCGIDPVRTICCALNRTNPAGGDINDGITADECLPNGICQNRVTDNGNEVTTWWLNFCTEPDIASGKCLDICREERNLGGGAVVTPCDGTGNSTRWCCGDTNKCCTNNIGIVQLPQRFVGRELSSTTALSSSAVTRTASPTASQTESLSATVSTPASSSETAQPQSHSLSAGAKAGIGVGAACGAIILLGALLFVRKAYSWRRNAKTSTLAEHVSSTEERPIEKYRQHGFPPSELSSATKPIELPPASPTELPGTIPTKSHFQE